jgi:hypothetical protein
MLVPPPFVAMAQHSRALLGQTEVRSSSAQTARTSAARMCSVPVLPSCAVDSIAASSLTSSSSTLSQACTCRHIRAQQQQSRDTHLRPTSASGGCESSCGSSICDSLPGYDDSRYSGSYNCDCSTPVEGASTQSELEALRRERDDVVLLVQELAAKAAGRYREARPM